MQWKELRKDFCRRLGCEQVPEVADQTKLFFWKRCHLRAYAADAGGGGDCFFLSVAAVLILARVAAVNAHGNPRAPSSNPTSCCSGCGSRRIDRTVIAPALVRTIAESSASVLPAKIPLNQRGLLLLTDFTLGTLHMTTSPNCTIGDVYSRQVTILYAVTLSFLMCYGL